MSKSNTEKCKACNGAGQRFIGMSPMMAKCVSHGYPSTYTCEHCYGTGKVTKGKTDYSISDSPGR